MKRLAILYNGETLTRWQKRAVDQVAADYELYFLVPQDSHRPARKPVRHSLYYLLNLVAIRNTQTRRVSYPVLEADSERCFHFLPTYNGAWGELTPEAIAWLADNRIDAVIKFGLGLLRIPEGVCPILSWHHGDPEYFRGRPAGFYELFEGKQFVGQIVQRLTNALDAGEVLAFAETRVHPHSYRKTLTEVYALSPYLLRPALNNLQQGRRVEKPVRGRNYRLPSNLKVARLVIASMVAMARRLAYAAFYEKRWAVSTAPSTATGGTAELVNNLEARQDRWKDWPNPAGFTFLADPFFYTEPNDLLVEAMHGSTGKGVIFRLKDGNAQILHAPDKFHLSYPGSFIENGVPYIVPEMAQGGRQCVYRIEEHRLVPERRLDINEEALIDPTLFRFEDRVYLFANRMEEGASILRLWFASGLFGRFTEHPKSPIRISARGSRMAGGISQNEHGLVRYGQDTRRSYGDGVLGFIIEELGPDRYQERPFGEAGFSRLKGPHTLNFMDRTIVFDWYKECFSPLAGARRLRARL